LNIGLSLTLVQIIRIRRLKRTNQKILKFEDVNSHDAFQFQICNRLKMKGWQFDKLSIEEKILKWTNRNPDKELVLEVNKELIFKKVQEDKSRTILMARLKIPENYEMGNPLNRWIHNDPIIRTQEQVDEDEKKIKVASEEEYKKIQRLIDSIKRKCNIKIVELDSTQQCI